jgi:hypothetical protein
MTILESGFSHEALDKVNFDDLTYKANLLKVSLGFSSLLRLKEVK